jgi:hypothetical protein
MRKKWFLVGLLATGVAFAATVTINLGDSMYQSRPAINGVSESDETAVRGGAMSQAVGLYRSTHGTSSIQTGQTVKFIYPDGATESGFVQNVNMSDSTLPAGDIVGGPCDLSPCTKPPPRNLGT